MCNAVFSVCIWSMVCLSSLFEYTQGVLDELKVDLDSTELLPSNRLSEVGSLVTELEAQADSNQVTLDALQDQVGVVT
jgi:hypothetical protein